jgi:aquaporin Z
MNQALDRPMNMLRMLREHWPEYLCEAVELGLFMVSAGLFTILLHHPGSPVVDFIPSEFTRRMLTGIAMGSTAIALVFSPLGKRSGAHFNPAVTLTFWRLGKMKSWDAVFYIIAQFIGAIAGVFAVTCVIREPLSHPTVNYAATLPGMQGVIVAFIAEFAIAFVLMSVVLRVSNTPHIARYTGLFAGGLVAIYITLESPLSGMSMNPARTFGSAFVGHLWTGLWIYFTAPVVAMQLAALIYLHGKGVVYCAKYHHYNRHRCIFNCRFPELLQREAIAGGIDAGSQNRGTTEPESSAPATTTINTQ